MDIIIFGCYHLCYILLYHFFVIPPPFNFYWTRDTLVSPFLQRWSQYSLIGPSLLCALPVVLMKHCSKQLQAEYCILFCTNNLKSSTLYRNWIYTEMGTKNAVIPVMLPFLLFLSIFVFKVWKCWHLSFAFNSNRILHEQILYIHSAINLFLHPTGLYTPWPLEVFYLLIPWPKKSLVFCPTAHCYVSSMLKKCFIIHICLDVKLFCEVSKTRVCVGTSRNSGKFTKGLYRPLGGGG